MRVLVTGGAGFIGSAVVRQYIRHTEATVINLDKLTVAASLKAVAEAAANARYHFVKADICDAPAVNEVFARYRPDAVLHLAAESHVDHSIDHPGAFVATNVVGTSVLLEAARKHWNCLRGEARERFRFLHVSTDEVYGSLGPEGLFIEDAPYRPNSPYSASKAGADHLVRAWHRTYGLPVLITHCSNNFGPYQHPEKLIPLMIMKALLGEPLPVYGQGTNVRDWLYVEDHAEALRLVLHKGRVGETYNVGGRNERTNIAVVTAACALLDEFLPESPYYPHAQLIAFVADRPGHDLRYAIEPAKIEGELGWAPRHGFDQALRATVTWYLTNRRWAEAEMAKGNNGARLGLAANLATR
ncbi:MAG: dTDP-glucose 4,6-dehydratase [Alphaproteobacteria bacterium]